MHDARKKEEECEKPAKPDFKTLHELAFSFHRRETIGLVLANERINDVAQLIPRNNLVELVESQVYAVIRQATLRVIISSNTRGAITVST